VSLLDWLFRRKPNPETPQSGRPSPGATRLREPECPVTFAASEKRPFDTIGEAEAAWQASDPTRAEKLFEQGIDAYKRIEPSGADFALGRYGAFLLDQDRKDEALRVLEQAIERKTDIPAIWSDYLRILSDRRDLDAFKRGIELMAVAVKHRVDPEFVLTHARRADREGASAFAEAIAQWVAERATSDGDQEGRWAAIGDLGHIIERAGRLDEAVKVWREAFDEGSRDPNTAGRLSMHLERAKDYATTMLVIRQALIRGLPASAEESLRKRLVRCESKAAGKAPSKASKPDVAAYSVRRGSALFEPIFQTRLKLPIKDLDLIGNAARCLLVSKDSSTLLDIDLVNGSEVRRVDHLPLLGDAWFASDGWGIGIHRTAAIGQGPTLLTFIDAEGHMAAESSVPDATSEISLGPDVWYVGCRNGLLYAFGFDGRQRWAWEMPGSKGYDENAYFRPCPYYVASQRSFAVVASMGNVYAVAPNGKTLWHAALPEERQTRWEFTIPLHGGRGNEEPYGILGIPLNAPLDQVKSAYRRLALATHPDRNTGDNAAADKFRLIQGAYERVLAGAPASGAVPAGITVSMEIQGVGPTASFVAANAAGVVVGSSQGRLYVFDGNGSLREARVVGDGSVRAALRPNGTVGAAWCSGALLFFKENRIVNAAEALDWPRALTMLGDEVVLWRGNEVQVMDANGQLLWSVEFSKSITGVAAHGDTLVCAAGVLTAFRRRRSE
jgi:outer membrane protein assembly factor BamB/tetratricopeptide (TPR) repeat protein